MYKRMFLIPAVLTMLSGCGGGGGGSTAPADVSYSGVTTQAAVSSSNAKALSAEAYSGNQLASELSGIGKMAVASDGQLSLVQETAAALETSIAAAVTAPKSSAKAVAAAVTVQNAIPGYSGTGSYSITVDPITGTFSGSFSFSQYKDTSTSAAMTGSLEFSGSFNSSSGTFSGMNMIFHNLSAIKGTASYTMSGSVTSSTSGTTKNVAITIMLADNVSGRNYWLSGYTLSLTGSALSVSGKYYHPVHGFVIISTITPLTVSTIDGTPTAGQLLFSGSNGTKARLTFAGSLQTVEADTTGSGSYVVIP